MLLDRKSETTALIKKLYRFFILLLISFQFKPNEFIGPKFYWLYILVVRKYINGNQFLQLIN